MASATSFACASKISYRKSSIHLPLYISLTLPDLPGFLLGVHDKRIDAGRAAEFVGFAVKDPRNFGFALVSVTGQILSPGLGRRSWGAFNPLNFWEAVMLPLALMFASVYLPPGVR